MYTKQLQQSTFTILSSSDLSWSKTRQITKVPSPPFSIAQKAIFACPAAEATRGRAKTPHTTAVLLLVHSIADYWIRFVIGPNF